MSRWLAIGAVLIVALAGCAQETPESDAPEAPDEPEDPEETTPEEGPEQPAPDATENAPPEVMFDADAVNGTQPLQVNFSIDASDPDGDAISWSLDADGDGEADDDGTEVPATTQFIYEEAANVTATLTVTAGDHMVNRSVLINVVNGTVIVPETWYTVVDDCEGDVVYLSQDDKDQSSCGIVGGTSHGYDYAADAPTGGFPAGAAVAGTLYINFYQPTGGALTITLAADGATVYTKTFEAGVYTPDTFTGFDLEGTLDAEIPSGATLSLSASSASTVGASYVGHGGATNSHITIGP